MYNGNNQLYAFIAAYQETSSIPSAGTVVTNANMPDGTVAVVDTENKVLSSLPSTGKVKIVQSMGSDKPLIHGPFMDVTELTITSANYIAPQEQISYIGWNGTSGTLPAENSTSFYLFIEKEDNDEMNRSNQQNGIHAQFKTSASSSAEEWAFLGANTLFKNTLFEVPNPDGGARYIRVMAVTDGTHTQATDGSSAVTAAVTFNSKTVEIGDANDVSVDDIISFGSTAGAQDTYKIAAISGTTITMNAPFRGASDAAAVLNVVSGNSNYGVRVAGVAGPYDPVADRLYYKNRFILKALSEGEAIDADTTTTQAASEGRGSWQDVGEKEFLSHGQMGRARNLMTAPFESRPTEYVEGGKYSIIQLEANSERKEMLGNSNFKTQLYIFLQLEGTDEDLPDGSQGDVLADTLVSGFSAGDLDA